LSRSASLSAQQVLLNQILFSLEAGQSLEKSLEFLKNQNLSKNLKNFVEDFHFYLKRGYAHEKFLFQKKKETSHQRAGKPDPDTAQSINNELKKLWGLK
jgi:type II secretory pathway component PulF